MSTVAIAGYVQALFWVYYVLIIIRIIFSWIGIPSQKQVLVFFRFVYDVTDPYLRIFRRFIPSMGGIDFSPMIAMLALVLIERIVVSIILSL